MTRSPTMNWMRPAWLLTALALIAGGCGSAPVTGVPADATVVPEDRVETLFGDSYSGIDDRRRRVIRESGTWENAWEQLHEGRSPVPERPGVDFGESMVILAAMGSRPTGGHGIEVESVHRDGASLFVVVVEASPGDSCVVTQAFTQPATALRVPRVAGEVHFVEREIVQECS